MIQYWLDREDVLWTFLEVDEGKQVLESEHGCLLRSTVEEFHGPLTPLFTEEDVRDAFSAGGDYAEIVITGEARRPAPDEDAYVAQLDG